MKKNKKRSALLLIVILLAVSIGFALLSTTLKINGITGVKKNTWSVYWDSLGNIVKTDGVVVNQEAIINQSDNTLVNFDVLLNVPGDYYEFQVDAVNAGTLNAMLDIVSVVINDDEDEELPNYLEFSVKYADDGELVPGHLLAKADSSTTPPTVTRERYKVRIKFKDTVTPEELDNIPEDSYSIQVKIPYKQATDEAVDPHATFTLPSGKTKDTLELDDELCVKDQCFTFVRYDGDNVVMLSKYNLKVGMDYTYNPNASGSKWSSTLHLDDEENYGLQSSDIRGKYGTLGEGTVYKGVVVYAAEQWSTNEYDVYDNLLSISKTTSPDFSSACNNSNNCFKTPGYSIAYYVNLYRSKLIASPYNVTLQNMRLLNKSEVENNFNCTYYSSPYDCNGAIANTSFWLGTGRYTNTVYHVENYGESGQYGASSMGTERTLGVRPVIVVKKSDL